MSLLLQESPILGGIVIASVALSIYHKKSNLIICICILALLFLLYFYRYFPTDIQDIPDNVILSPCEGKIINITDRYGYYYIAIFMSPFNVHYQIYPVNGKVIKREYDRTGQFNVVMNLGKSRNNEKKRHYIRMKNNNTLLLTQIAGFLPRVITSSDQENLNVKAGDYLGMIKFGSRIDMIIPKKAEDGSILKLNVNVSDNIKVSDYLGEYVIE